MSKVTLKGWEFYESRFHVSQRMRSNSGLGLGQKYVSSKSSTAVHGGKIVSYRWACATLNFARHNLDAVIMKVFDALNPGGVFISFRDGMTHERTQLGLGKK